MIRRSIQSLKPGMVVGKAVFDSQGNVLIASGVELTVKYIQGLKDRGISGCFIQDGQTDDIIPNENITDHVRSSTIQKMTDIFNQVQGINKHFKVQSKSALIDTIHSDRYQDAVNKSPEFKRLTSGVKGIVTELISSPQILLGMNSLKNYDDYVFQHATEVSITAIMIGRKIGLSHKRLQELGMGCLLMDIGNIFLPKEVLQKSGKLTKEEFAIIKEHPVIGYELLKNINSIGVLPSHVAFQHHEKQDGTGYPRGLTGNNSTLISDEPRSIHLYASIASIADVYDSLSSDTPYRKAFPREKVITMMSKLGGTHFNKDVLRAFLKITPVYPEGSTVRITIGKHKNKIGVVTEVNREDMARPVIRLFMDTTNKPVSPEVINLLDDKLVKVESILL